MCTDAIFYMLDIKEALLHFDKIMISTGFLRASYIISPIPLFRPDSVSLDLLTHLF